MLDKIKEIFDATDVSGLQKLINVVEYVLTYIFNYIADDQGWNKDDAE